jgi:hypothetical protein
MDRCKTCTPHEQHNTATVGSVVLLVHSSTVASCSMERCRNGKTPCDTSKVQQEHYCVDWLCRWQISVQGKVKVEWEAEGKDDGAEEM